MPNPKDPDVKTGLPNNSDPAIPAAAAGEPEQLARPFVRENRGGLRELAVGRKGLLVAKATGRVITPEMVKEGSEDDLD